MHPIVSVQWLSTHLEQIKILDITHTLADPDFGVQCFLAGHIPGAQFIHLDHGLSDVSAVSQLGRHPLPKVDALARTLASCGIKRSDTVICYDQDTGAFAARAWWLLSAAGFVNVAVLDGGMQAWKASGLAISREVLPLQGDVPEALTLTEMPQLSFEQLSAALAEHSITLVDARGANRFAGADETIDPVAGRVPGAINRPFTENLQNGRFKSPESLRTEFSALLGDCPPEKAVMMCGSGVTACHNLLAMAAAGLPGAALFAPSWSGWILDPARPVATGLA